MTDQREESSLSRAVSSLDLNAALAATRRKLRDGAYSAAELLKLRPKTEESELEGDQVNPSKPPPDGILTPPDASLPNAPPSTPEVTHSIDSVAHALAEDDLNEDGIQVVPAGSEAKKKKKKKKSRGGANKKPKPTGFEEFYADPPITPAEHEEECETYSPNVAFHERIQTCIQKYRARRNLDSLRNNILTKYFMLGGIEASTSKAFTGGLDKATIEDSTADEIRAIQATDYVTTGSSKYYDPQAPEGWVVDFEGVAKGFFGHRIPTQFSTDREEDIKTYTAVIRNFLNYVLAHAVCPEYNDDVMAAREICNEAEVQLMTIKRLGYSLPGDFNIAASTLYGGRYENRHISTQQWEDDVGGDAVILMLGGLSVPDAQRIFKTAIAFDGNEEMFNKVMAEDVKIINTESRCFEVIGIERASEESIQQYASVKNALGEAGAIKALGVLVVKPRDGPGMFEEDFTDDEGNTVVDASGEKLDRFWVEDEILKDVFIGLKMEVVVNELDIGMKFFDGIEGLYCSFHTYLPNEKMSGWKEPVPNTRPAPTEDDPHVEENALFDDMEGDFKDDEKVDLSKI